MVPVLTKEQADAINAARREAEALDNLVGIGARIVMQEPNCVVVCLHSTKGKRKSFTAHSAVSVLEDVQSFIASQNRLKHDAPSRFDVVLEDAPEVEIVQRVGSENADRDARRRELEIDTQGRVVGLVDSN